MQMAVDYWQIGVYAVGWAFAVGKLYQQSQDMKDDAKKHSEAVQKLEAKLDKKSSDYEAILQSMRRELEHGQKILKEEFQSVGNRMQVQLDTISANVVNENIATVELKTRFAAFESLERDRHLRLDTALDELKGSLNRNTSKVHNMEVWQAGAAQSLKGLETWREDVTEQLRHLEGSGGD